MNNLNLAILYGLQVHGRSKSFSQLLDDARIPYTKDGLLEIAENLETLGLIQSVTYQLPIAITAELSSYGKEVLLRAQNESARNERFQAE